MPRNKDMLTLFAMARRDEVPVDRLAQALGKQKTVRIRPRHVRGAIRRLERRGWIAKVDDEGRLYRVTEEGVDAARDWAMAIAVGEFEPELLSSMKQDELKAPFPRREFP